MVEFEKSQRVRKYHNHYLLLLNRLWTAWDNEKWQLEIPQLIAMFRDDELGKISTLPFPEFYKRLKGNFIPTKVGWIQTAESEKGKYIAKARLLRSGIKAFGREIGSGERKYDPDKPNFIYHHWASAENPELQAEALRIAIPELEKFNVIVIKAHGHNRNYDNEPGNAMTRSFPTMESIQGTLAASIMLSENIARCLKKPTVFAGISMGGVVGLWGSIVEESKIDKRFIIAAHPEYRRIFFNDQFRGQINRYGDRLALFGKPNDYTYNDMSEVNIDEGVEGSNRNTYLFYGTEDLTVNSSNVLNTIQSLGITNSYSYPLDHKTMSAAFPDIINVIREQLREYISV
ncbi:hypothetical protein A2863_04005 [Candidatus Woesebacteria bacterium RIFCSPHIGHO2_01_FULL_38_9b]|uniref:Peptidase S9 prolyl oligopeptidase catalytic domain-containing protein n=1 Tax=Candidatus Woesebacteria bacterium RIFCSPHIGHO2_01_FULL_38_9b TaxID=1802493 RepID=A0A1F7Y2U8_9BACT|nr:MAG: hypothetical protein A2863_04005 [Candidatus Woesebacteria bacterium RIFCSPHIGHO2_01_FULL_38_9b]